MSNTLLNYFKKADNSNKTLLSSPSTALKKEPKQVASPKIEKENACPKEEKMDVEIYDDEEIIRPKIKRIIEAKDSPRVKRKRLMIASDSDSEPETKTKSKKKLDSSPEFQPKSEEESESNHDDSFINDDDEDDDEPKAKKKSLSTRAINSPKTPKSKPTKNKQETPSSSTKPSLSSFAANTDNDCSIEGKFKHFSYDFLQEDKIKDLNGRLKSDPNYDPRTLLVPESFKKTITPGLRQWWDLKQRNFDVIIFFKVGKFYELYHMDAVIAVKELGLTFMKGDYAHCGFPEVAFSRFADALVSKGYKVGRVEQTETPEMMAVRIKGTRQDKTVRREICRITTPGTKTFNVLDGEISNAFSQYLFSFIEKVGTNQEKRTRSFGVCFVDTTCGKVHIGQFQDDRNCSKFRTTLAQYPPAHILYERNNISKEAKSIVDYQSGIKEAINHEKEMFSASTLLRMLSEGDYFKEKGEFEWPEKFRQVLSDHDTLGLTAKIDFELAVNAMGGILWCLKNCLIDHEILSMKNIEIYNPVDNLITIDTKKHDLKKKFAKQKYMVLDSISLTNLEVFENNFDNTQSGTLYEKLDFCNTQFGKRLLKYWLVNPLCDHESINDRLDAIEDLKNLDEKLSYITEQLKNLPDLERLISKIHQLGNIAKDHPESRAIMYENDTYSKKKVEDFLTIITGFGIASKLFSSLKDLSSKSNLLKTILTIIKTEDAGKKLGFPNLNELLEKYKNSFNAEEAKKSGRIIPSEGFNQDYDTAVKDINKIVRDLDKYLNEQKKQFNCSTICYFGTSRNRYQLEIPENKCKNLPNDYELTSSKKGFKRYWNDELKDLIALLTDAEERKEKALRDNMKCLFKDFDKHFNVWNRAVQCLAILDVLVSLTQYVRNSEFDMCRPDIVMLDDDESNDRLSPFIEIKNGRHPCLGKTFSGDFIPNDLVIGYEDAEAKWQKNPLVVVTGPNMGGKSTLMRQVGLIVILAQMGCYVPAEKCRLSPVDRIFTRIGASDKILAGESTFYLELSETASILHHASKHSLVLMDELGRGTATFDGTAIAYSVVKELAQNLNCRTLFSTHYHHLVEEFSDKDNVSMGHMQCMVNDDDQSITFLYKFGQGACPKSHGFNAARLADVPEEIIKLGSTKSVEFENFTKKIQLLKKLMHLKKKEEVTDITEKFKNL
ncbi:unnamed protein product [Brachionus calyciflorus]|uniref:DNA mismatch repair protein n=1 Tax=Brachionus calyciflorus TaxID=104777 RepID=A0A813UQW3_9BILA|nr:unnamed protein product [Brachionus calyciflorus]